MRGTLPGCVRHRSLAEGGCISRHVSVRVEYNPDLANQIDPRGNLVRVGASHITVTIDPTVMDGWVEIDTDGVGVSVNSATWDKIIEAVERK